MRKTKDFKGLFCWRSCRHLRLAGVIFMILFIPSLPLSLSFYVSFAHSPLVLIIDVIGRNFNYTHLS